MAHRVRDLMTGSPVCIESSATVAEAAAMMDNHDIGDVLVLKGGKLLGIVTDRDIALRAVARGHDPSSTRVGEICSATAVAALHPDDTVDQAVVLMRDRAVRRVPVVEGGKPVGVLTLGDLAVQLDPQSVLAHISAAPPNQ